MLGERVVLKHLIGTVRSEEGKKPRSSLFGNKPQNFSLYVLAVLGELQNI